MHFVSGVYAYDIVAFVNALNYLKTLATSVINNQAPSSNYQTLNGVLLANQAIQIIDSTLTTETGIDTTINTLVSIVNKLL